MAEIESRRSVGAPRGAQLAHDLRLRELVEGVYLKENVMSIESRLDQAQVTPRFGLGHRARARRAEEEEEELGALTHERAAVIDRRHPERAELDLRVARDGRQALCPSPLAPAATESLPSYLTKHHAVGLV